MLLVLLVLLQPVPSQAYAVLTHEQIIDMTWNDSIRPLLLSRYPSLTEYQLNEAHAYAYGGAAIQDLGYYPFSHEFFSDLAHYVRSGDFIASLFRNARNANELAFAIGALSHYVGDNIGHSECVNPATAIEFPKLARKYGDFVTYDESPHAHVRTEFAFDIDQLRQHRFAPAAYLEYIGLRVPAPQLERAFYDTYGLHLREVLGPVFPATRSYRGSVRHFIPRIAHAETVLHRHSPPDVSNDAFAVFESNLQNAAYEKRWDGGQKHPGFVAHLLAMVIFVLPKIGPLSDLAIRGPNQQTQQWYIQSVNDALAEFRHILHNLNEHPGATIALANRDLDTGALVRPGAYALTDKTYAKLLQQITADPDRHVPFGIRRDLVAFYSYPDAPIVTKKNHHAWEQVQKELLTLQQMPVRPRSEPDGVANGLVETP